MKEIYLDNAATTSVYKKVIFEMNKYNSKIYANPNSIHILGEKAAKALNESRKNIASEINAKPHEIIFTSGTTESNNLAILGLSRKNKNKILVSSIEHSSIFEMCAFLEKKGFNIVQIPVNSEGFVDIDFIEKNTDKSTLLVSVIHANNEIGVIQDLNLIGKICRSKNILFHTDCAQSFGKERIDVQAMKIDMLSAGAHKIHGPKGIGFLYIREGIKIEPIIYGGGQERGLRGGTENIPSIVGFAKSLELIKKVNKTDIKKLRDYSFLQIEKIGGKINGNKEKRLYNNINVILPGIDSEYLVHLLSSKGIYISSGSACDTKKQKESKVLREIGLKEKDIKSSIRISLSEYTTKKDIDYVIKEIEKALTSALLR